MGEQDPSEEPLPAFPGFRQMAERRRRLVAELAERRRAQGLSQTEVAARMGTSQSAVARLEPQAGDVRLSTLERYAGALGEQLNWHLSNTEGNAQ
jgi:transcriptional regulator with XRE-family HTH domain